MVSEELTRMRTGFVYSLRLNLGFSYTSVENIAALRIQEIGSFGKMQIHVRVEKKRRRFISLKGIRSSIQIFIISHTSNTEEIPPDFCCLLYKAQ